MATSYLAYIYDGRYRCSMGTRGKRAIISILISGTASKDASAASAADNDAKHGERGEKIMFSARGIEELSQLFHSNVVLW